VHPPDKPNPTTGQDGRAVKNKSFGSKQDRNYSDQSDFTTEETALAYALRRALARKAVRS
jgi:hypothetical protein